MESVVELVCDNYSECTIVIIFTSLLVCCASLVVQRSRSISKNQSSKLLNQDIGERHQRNKMSSMYGPSLESANVTRDRSFGLITSYPCSSPRSMLNDRSKSFGEDGDSDANLHLEKLQIRPPEEASPSPRLRSFSPRTSYSPPLMMSPTFMRGDHLIPLWKDYPMVHKAVPSSHSYCSMPLSSYPNSGYGSPIYSPSNYRSSSVATIFGGPKPIISPPKLDVGFTSRYDSNVSASPTYSYHSGHGRQSWIYGLPAENSMSPYLASPLSRSSSQSSGFVSQKEFHTPPATSPNLPSFDSNTAFGDQDKFINSELHIGANSPQIGSFLSKDYTSFSSLNNCNSITPSEMNLRQGRIWSSPSFVTIASSGINVSRNTCSRFARKETSTGSLLRQMNESERPVSSSLYSDDDEDSDDSFESARTTLTRQTRAGSSRPATTLRNEFVRSKSKIRSGPFMRNLRATSLLEDRSVKNEEREGRLQHGAANVQDPSLCAGLWSLAVQLFWSLSVFFNVVLMFWMIFGVPYDAQESHWIHHLIHNVSDAVMVNTNIFWESLQQTVLDLLAAKEVERNINPTVLIIKDY